MASDGKVDSVYETKDETYGKWLKEHMDLPNVQSYLNTIESIITESNLHTSDDYTLSENLLFLLQIYQITANEKYLNIVITTVKSYIEKISVNQADTNYLGMGFVCLEIYRLNNDELLLKEALLTVKFEASLNIISFQKEQITLRNLFAQLQLFYISKEDELLFNINLSIIKLLNWSRFEKNKIYWPYLYRLNLNDRINEERLFKLIFLKLYELFHNDSFLYIANNVKQSRITKTNVGLEAISTVLDTFIELNYAFLFEKSHPDFKVATITKKNKNKNPLYGLILVISNYYCFYFTGKLDYFYLLKASVDNILFQQQIVNNNLLTLSDSILKRSNFFLKAFFYTGQQDSSSIYKDDFHYSNLEDNYPGVCITVNEIKQMILFNSFPKIVTLLRDQIPAKFNRYLQAEVTPDIIQSFFYFLRKTSKSNPKLNEYLNPIFKLELSEYRLMNKYITLNYEPFDNYHATLLKLDFDGFIDLNLDIITNFIIINIKTPPIIKTYLFTFLQWFIDASEMSIMIRYNTLTYKVEEFQVDRLDVLILNTFKSERKTTIVIEKVLSFIDYNNEDSAYVQQLIIKKINNFIRNNILRLI